MIFTMIRFTRFGCRTYIMDDTATTTIATQEQWVIQRLEKFYTPERIENLREILSSKTGGVSLRILDWFVTNYSKKNNVSYVTKSGKHVIVYLAYKSHLKAYSKKMFDPFCRHERIDFHGVSTTVGQLNFFAWAIEDECIDYMHSHIDDIHADMETRMTAAAASAGGGGGDARKKRHELSHSATKSIKHHDVKIMVSFK
jgi:hypothetical protein